VNNLTAEQIEFEPLTESRFTVGVFQSAHDPASVIYVSTVPHITPQEARTLARFLLTAADKLDGLL
jgi:hypothetical protein